MYLILFGIIQGLTEFLPVSSSGHLQLLYNIFGLSTDNLMLSIVLHVATLMSVLVVYRADIIKLIKHPLCNTNISLAKATVPTVIVVLLLKNTLYKLFGGFGIVFAFLISAILLALADYKNNSATNLQDITNIKLTTKQCTLIGMTQGLACVPGISRSGSTISCAMMQGVDSNTATKFSFLLSIPIICASLIYEIMHGGSLVEISILWLSVSFVCAFVVGIFAIKWLTKLTKIGKLHYFSYYLMILCTIYIILNLV